MVVDWKGVLAIGAVLGIGIYLARKQAAQAVSAVGAAVNPLSDQNLPSKGAAALTSAFTGSVLPSGEATPIGVQIFDFLHPGQ